MRKFLSSFFLACARIFHKTANLFTAMAAGVCDLEKLLGYSRKFWDEDISYRLQEAPQVLSGLMAWEVPIADFLKPGGMISIIGCGAGRDMIAFGRMGYRVDGIDISPRAVRCAEEYLAKAGVQGRVFCADVADFEFPEKVYDAFVFSWFTYGYFFPASRRIQALKNLYSKLAPDGCVILTLLPFHGEGRTMVQIARWLAKLAGNPHPPSKGDCFNLNLQFEHHFTRQEVEEESRLAGFRVSVYRDGRQLIAVLKKA